MKKINQDTSVNIGYEINGKTYIEVFQLNFEIYARQKNNKLLNIMCLEGV